MKKVLDSLWSVVISLTSEVTLMRRPTTGGTLLKPNNLRKDKVERITKTLFYLYPYGYSCFVNE